MIAHCKLPVIRILKGLGHLAYRYNLFTSSQGYSYLAVIPGWPVHQASCRYRGCCWWRWRRWCRWTRSEDVNAEWLGKFNFIYIRIHKLLLLTFILILLDCRVVPWQRWLPSVDFGQFQEFCAMKIANSKSEMEENIWNFMKVGTNDPWGPKQGILCLFSS